MRALSSTLRVHLGQNKASNPQLETKTMKELTIKYTILKSLDLSNAMESCSKVASKERAISKLDSNVWENTVCTIMESIDYTAYSCDTSKDGIAAIREILFTQMEKAIYAVTTIPETGQDRDGKTIELLNQKTSKIKWSSWEKTRRIFAYLGDIAKILAHDKGDLLYPEQYKVAARCDILQQLGKTGTALEHVTRLAKQMDSYLPVLEETEKADAQLIISGLKVAGVDPIIEAATLMARLDSIVSGASKEQKESIKELLYSFGTKHYPVAA